MKPRCRSLALSCQENGSISESCSRKESYLYDRALTCICGWCGESLDAFLIPCNDFYGRIFSVLNAVLSDSPKMTSIQFWFWTLSLEYQDFSRSLGCVDDTAHDEIFSRHSFTLVNYSEIFPQLVEEFFVLLFLFVFQIIYLLFQALGLHMLVSRFKLHDTIHVSVLWNAGSSSQCDDVHTSISLASCSRSSGIH